MPSKYVRSRSLLTGQVSCPVCSRLVLCPVDLRLLARWRQRALAGGPAGSVRRAQRPVDRLRQREESNAEGKPGLHGSGN